MKKLQILFLLYRKMQQKVKLSFDKTNLLNYENLKTTLITIHWE